MEKHSDTIVALATPPGVGALGVIRLSGPDAIRIADEIFVGKKLSKAASHSIHFGNIQEADKIIDEVLAFVFKSPNSYTKEDTVEFSCHGSNYILQSVLRLCIQAGARSAEAGEFTLRAFLHGQMDLSQAEAVADLIASESAAAHSLAIDQLRGGISDRISQLRKELIHFASLIELELDFGEEDVEFANRSDLKNLILKIKQLLKDLIDSFQLGNAIKEGISTVIAGRPNAGKSTLLNALLEEDRAIVSDIAGTTRDTIEELLNIQGLQFRLIDTAGIRDAQDKIESIGIAKTMDKIASSSIIIYVMDVIEVKPDMLWADLEKIQTDGAKTFVVLNKMDLNPYTEAKDYAKQGLIAEDHIITASALNKMNIAYLKTALYDTVLKEEFNRSSVVVSNSRHYNALMKSDESLTAALQGMSDNVSSDFIAMDIRQSLHYLGLITGEISTDDLLENIFSKFCIGK